MPEPVLLLIQSLGLGGTERQFCTLARALDRTRFEPHVGLLRAEGFRVPEIESAGLPIANFAVRSFLGPEVLAGAARLIRYIRKHGIRIVHAFDTPTVLFGVPVAKLVPGTIALSSQRSHRELTPGTFAAVRRWALRRTDRMADAVLVNCEYLGRHLVEDEKVPEKSIVLCYNGIDLNAFAAANRTRPPELAGASVIVGVVSALRPEKNLGMLIEAFARVRQTYQEAELVFVGDGSCREELGILARNLNIENACRFIPGTKDVAGWLRAIDIFVLPSVSEGFSNSLLEAMACGCCAVASRVGGNPEMVRDGETGLLFESRDVDGMTAALSRLIGDPDLRIRLAEAGTRYVRDRFSISDSGARLDEIYSMLLAR